MVVTDPVVSLHDVITGAGILAGFVYQAWAGRRAQEKLDASNREVQIKLHTENRERLDQILRWKKDHEQEANQRDAGIAQLRELTATLKEMAAGQHRRLELLEQRQPVWYDAEKTAPPKRHGS